MQKAHIIFLVADQRSGTNMLRSSIEAHSKFLKSGEIFYPPEDDIGQSQFFSLVKQMSQSDDGIYTRKQETMNELFERYIALLRDHLQFHEKNFVLADVKYSSTHHLNAGNYWGTDLNGSLLDAGYDNTASYPVNALVFYTTYIFLISYFRICFSR